MVSVCAAASRCTSRTRRWSAPATGRRDMPNPAAGAGGHAAARLRRAAIPPAASAGIDTTSKTASSGGMCR